MLLEFPSIVAVKLADVGRTSQVRESSERWLDFRLVADVDGEHIAVVVVVADDNTVVHVLPHYSDH